MNSPFFPERGSDLSKKLLSEQARHKVLLSAAVKKLEAACLEAVYGYEKSYYSSNSNSGTLDVPIPVVAGVSSEEVAQPVIDALAVVGVKAYQLFGNTLTLETI